MEEASFGGLYSHGIKSLISIWKQTSNKGGFFVGEI